MNSLLSIPTALCLPAPDITALIQGRVIAAIPRMFIRPGQTFALYPVGLSSIPLSADKYYRLNFLSISQSISKNFTINQKIPEVSEVSEVSIQAWAKCEGSKIIDDSQSFDKLSQLTIWTQEGLEKILEQQEYIFLSYLRVYELSQPYEVSQKIEANKFGRFVGLSDSLRVSDENPILTDNIFFTRKQQLEKLEPPKHPELEEFLGVLSPFALSNPAAKKLEEDIQVFLGWNTQRVNQQVNSNGSWINDIAALGNRSKEQDRGKSNYQAGTDFENIVRQSLEFLGFTVDHFHKGGAGGVDVFCSHPYPLIGECKSGKSIPNDTAVQLLNLGTLRLQTQVKQATQLIIGPGEATKQLKDAAKVHGMAIINPETLEKLVKLQSKYHNSIDLFKLQDFLKAGQSDAEVEKYIVQVEEEIKLRSHIIKAVKELSDQDTEIFLAKQKGFTVTEIRAHYNATHNPKLRNELVYHLLIELSSPLTGYLGRIKSNEWKTDKFYFLRDLSI